MSAVSGMGICCSSQVHCPCWISPGRGQEWPASRSRYSLNFNTYLQSIAAMNIPFVFVSDKLGGSNIPWSAKHCTSDQVQDRRPARLKLVWHKTIPGAVPLPHWSDPQRCHRPHSCGLGKGWPPRRSRRRHSSSLVRNSQRLGFRQVCNRSR